MRSRNLIHSKEDVKVIHSSLSHVLTLGVDAEFPGYPASIGVLLERSHTSPGIYFISHMPKLSSLETGELLGLSSDSDDLDTRLRSELLSQADACEKLSADLLSHAKRLRLEARKEILIHDTEETIPVFASPLSPLPDKNRARLLDDSGATPLDIDISAFDE